MPKGLIKKIILLILFSLLSVLGFRLLNLYKIYKTTIGAAPELTTWPTENEKFKKWKIIKTTATPNKYFLKKEARHWLEVYKKKQRQRPELRFERSCLEDVTEENKKLKEKLEYCKNIREAQQQKAAAIATLENNKVRIEELKKDVATIKLAIEDIKNLTDKNSIFKEKNATLYQEINRIKIIISSLELNIKYPMPKI